jgi:hypothetical protein
MEVRNTSAGFVHLLRFDTILILFYLSLPGFAGRMSDAWKRPFLMKAIAIISSAFDEILFLDADNIPLADPTPLFESEPYVNH